jgi:hypothetical protein
MGYELIITDRHGRMLTLDPERERLRDRAGRRFPSHLDAGPTPGYFDVDSPRRWWGWERIAWPFEREPVPEFTYWQRPRPLGTGETSSSGDTTWDDAT